MPKTTKNDTTTAYKDRLLDVSALLDWIGQEISMHDEYATTDGINWAHAGEMGHYRERLMEILISLLGNASETESRKMIEEALEELKA